MSWLDGLVGAMEALSTVDEAELARHGITMVIRKAGDEKPIVIGHRVDTRTQSVAAGSVPSTGPASAAPLPATHTCILCNASFSPAAPGVCSRSHGGSLTSTTTKETVRDTTSGAAWYNGGGGSYVHRTTRTYWSCCGRSENAQGCFEQPHRSSTVTSTSTQASCATCADCNPACNAERSCHGCHKVYFCSELQWASESFTGYCVVCIKRIENGEQVDEVACDHTYASLGGRGSQQGPVLQSRTGPSAATESDASIEQPAADGRDPALDCKLHEVFGVFAGRCPSRQDHACRLLNTIMQFSGIYVYNDPNSAPLYVTAVAWLLAQLARMHAWLSEEEQASLQVYKVLHNHVIVRDVIKAHSAWFAGPVWQRFLHCSASRACQRGHFSVASLRIDQQRAADVDYAKMRQHFEADAQAIKQVVEDNKRRRKEAEEDAIWRRNQEVLGRSAAMWSRSQWEEFVHEDSYPGGGKLHDQSCAWWHRAHERSTRQSAF